MVVEDDSMLPALRAGDRLLVDPMTIGPDGPGRGEIVVLRDPERPGRLLVKRVGATEGEPDPSGAPVPFWYRLSRRGRPGPSWTAGRSVPCRSTASSGAFGSVTLLRTDGAP